jgi:hypothetical protein
LDALGTKESYEKVDSEILKQRWNNLDQKLHMLVNKLKYELGNSKILTQCPAEFCEKANWIGIMASPLTAEVLDRAASIDKYSNDWFKTFIEYDFLLMRKRLKERT